MTLEQLEAVLFWSMAINFGVLLWWALCLLCARRWVYRAHAKFFQISESAFDRLHYAGMMTYKLAIIMFNAAPWAALHIVA